MRKLRTNKSARLQSAMEYLMTYGWAILIIAVVLGALFSLGVFNGANFAPKAPPGACQVFRPNGPGSTSFINLEGVCSGELPQYVAQFNGQTSYIQTLQSINLPTDSSWVFWMNPASFNPSWGNKGLFGSEGWGATTITAVLFSSDNVSFQIGNSSGAAFAAVDPSAVLINTWVQYILTINQASHEIYLYRNGVRIASTSYLGSIGFNAPVKVTNNWNTYYNNQWSAVLFNGSIANLQLYNTSLSGPEVNALYLEGISGAPIDLQNLVGWWPLNGNANDYSGNMNNGVPSNVVFTSSWESGYTTP